MYLNTLRYPILLLFIISVLSRAHAANPVVNHDLNSVFWSPLTDIEASTLTNVPRAKSGDPDALLALAILASGDHRSKAEYNRIKTRIKQFVNDLKPSLARETNIWRKGFFLYTAMHEEFFSNRIPADDLKGYRLNQSRLTQIFKDQTYNCISSSLLYLILARYFDLTVDGVILPTHAFVQLTTPEGQVIEIETTSKKGYGLRHNQEFYEHNASQWSQLRNLPSLRYQDYLQRKIVSVFQLIIENMNHQHTAAGQMRQSDRYRLSEIRAWLLPEDATAQRYRLYVFNNELIRLKQKRDFQSALRLLNIAQSSIRFYTQALKSAEPPDDTIHAIVTFMFASRAEIALENNDFQQAIRHFKQAMKWVKDPARTRQLQQNISITWLNQGNLFFARQEYNDAISHYDRAYSKHNDNELQQKIDNNISAAYWNRAIVNLNAGDSYSAYELLDQCLSNYPHIQACSEKKELICQSYTLAACRN